MVASPAWGGSAARQPPGGSFWRARSSGFISQAAASETCCTGGTASREVQRTCPGGVNSCSSPSLAVGSACTEHSILGADAAGVWGRMVRSHGAPSAPKLLQRWPQPKSPPEDRTLASHIPPNCHPMPRGLVGQGVRTCTESALKHTLHRSSCLPLPANRGDFHLLSSGKPLAKVI